MAPAAQHEGGPAAAFAGLDVLEELVGRGAAQPGIEAVALHAATRDRPLVGARASHFAFWRSFSVTWSLSPDTS